MYRVKGAGRAHIPHPEKHIAGILKGGVRPSRFDPHFQVPEQMPPTDHLKLRQRFRFGSVGHLDSLHHNPGPGDHNEVPVPNPYAKPPPPVAPERKGLVPPPPLVPRSSPPPEMLKPLPPREPKRAVPAKPAKPKPKEPLLRRGQQYT
jgi:hypothetical protein